MNGWAIMIERFAHALGNALVQSLWQCVLIGAIVSLGVVMTRRASARYTLWCVGLFACGAWFVVTLVEGLRTEQASLAQAYTQMLADPIAGESPIRVGVFEIIACVWAFGFLVLSTRFALQWRAAWLLRTRALIPARPEWDAMYEEIRDALGVSRRVCLRVSERALCPMVVGVFVPIVLVPASVMMMLTPAQVRMVLAHELAHVRRYDHVVNMVQVMIETVMFYHPLVWWISRQARIEREHCCDDAAVRMCGDALGYARALTELEEVRLQSRAVLGLQGGSLMKRVQRIIGDDAMRRGSVSVKVMAAVLTVTMIAVAACTTGFVREEAAVYDSYDALKAAVASGEVSEVEARVIYERELLPSSWIAERCDDERAYWVEELKTYELSDDRMAKTLNAMEREFEQRIEKDFRTRVLGQNGREVTLSMYRKELEWYQREEGLSEDVAERMYAKRVQELSQPATVVSLPDTSRVNEVEGETHFFRISSGGDSVKGAPVRLVEGTKAAGVFEVEDTVPADSEYTPGQRIRFTPGMSMPMARAMRGQTAEEQWLMSNGGENEEQPVLETESEPQGRKLTPMDEEYWIHQGIRPLDAYDESFADDC